LGNSPQAAAVAGRRRLRLGFKGRLLGLRGMWAVGMWFRGTWRPTSTRWPWGPTVLAARPPDHARRHGMEGEKVEIIELAGGARVP
jgi:hypothetical protein